MSIASCLMIDDSGDVKPCVEATILCEKHISPIDKQLCLDKTIASSSITFNSSTEKTFPSTQVIQYINNDVIPYNSK